MATYRQKAGDVLEGRLVGSSGVSAGRSEPLGASELSGQLLALFPGDGLLELRKVVLFFTVGEGIVSK